MEGLLRTRNTVLVGLVLVVIALGLSYLVYGIGGTEVQAQQQECPSPRLIDEVTGNGEQQTAPFNSTTDLLRISYDAQAERDTTPLIVNVRDADDPETPSVGDATTQGTESGQSFINAPPGRYFLDIGTTDAQYTIRVEECGEGGEANPGEGTNVEGSASPKTPATPSKTPATPPKTPATPPKSPSPAPRPPAPPSPPPNSGTLMNAGGSTAGPVPVMPNGSCPQEFPERRGDACYSL